MTRPDKHAARFGDDDTRRMRIVNRWLATMDLQLTPWQQEIYRRVLNDPVWRGSH